MSIRRPALNLLKEKPRLRFEAGFLLVTIIVVAACLSLLFRAPGFPQNHEYFSYELRTAIYADHFRKGDIFPIWASSDGLGMGTPLPLFYHKTFYYLSGSIYLIFGSMKAAITASLAVFMLIGAYGMRFCIAKVTKHRNYLVLGPQALLLSNYAFTDWLVRGATAEFTAVMVGPWLIWWCLVLVRENRFSLAIAPILFLLIESHNVTALFGVILPLIAYGVFLYSTRVKGLLQTWRRGLLSVGILGLLLGPQLILQKLFLSDYDPSKVIQSGFTASNNFRPASQYLSSNGFVWLKDWRFMTIQIDYGIWVALAAALVALAVGLLVSRSATTKWAKNLTMQPYFVFLALSFIAYLFLQLRLSKPLYEHVEIMQYLQFPWRLLAYITLIGILLAVMFLAKLRLPRAAAMSLAIVWIATFVTFSPLLHRFQYAFFSPREIQEITTVGYPQQTGRELAGIGEYYPRVFDGQGAELSSISTVQLYQSLFDQQRELQVLGGYCNIVALPQHSLEASTLYFRYTCDSNSQVALPVSFSRLSYVTNDLDQEKVARFRRPDDPRMLVSLKPGSGLLEVHLPSLATAWHVLWTR